MSGTQVYNGTVTMIGSALTATGVHGETFSVSGTGAGDLSVKDVQSNQALDNVTNLTLGSGNTGAAVSTNYNALSTTGSSVSVTKADATVTANSASVTYNGLSQSVSGFSATGLVGSETVAVLTGVSEVGGSSKIKLDNHSRVHDP